MAREPFREQEIGRQRVKIALAHGDDALRIGRHNRAHDLRARLLERFVHDALADFLDERALRGDPEPVIGKFDPVRGLAFPDGEDDVDCLCKHPRAVFAQIAERLRIGGECPWADAENKTALRKVIEHRRVRGDQNRM